LKASALATSTSSTKVGHPKIEEGYKGPKLSNSGAQTSWQIKCHFCQLNHFIYKCEGFQALSLDKKKKFVLSNNMCLGCLRSGHSAKDCNRKTTCNICKQSHPTPLHEEQPKTTGAEAKEENASTALYCKKANNCNHTSMIIPVWLSCAKVDSPEVLVYALLDTQSSNTFVDQDVCEGINADSEPVRLKLSTMTDRSSIVNCRRVSGLKVRGYFSQEEKIVLPPAYTQEYIPLEKSSIRTRKTAGTWDHLPSIAKEMPDELDCPVGLLIGYDCAGALKPRRVIAGKDQDPFAVRTDLGWCIVGPTAPLSSPGDIAGYCHRISSKEIPPITPTSIIRALEMDFLDTNPREKTVSQEDIKFLEMLNGEILHNNEGHLEMPLPFRARPHLPKNKHLAEVRLKHLKIKFEKNPKFARDYIKFMEHVFNEEDAEEVDGLLRVGGRLKEATSLEARHPIILPKKGIVTHLILDFCHKKTQHQGRGMTMNEIRTNGYWVISASKVVARHKKKKEKKNDVYDPNKCYFCKV